MTIDNVLEILEKHKLHIPSNVFYELKADIVNFEEPTPKNDSEVDCIDRQATLDAIIKKLGISNESYLLPAEKTIYQQIKDMPLVTPQEPILDKIRAEINNLTVYYTTKDKGINLISQNAVNRIFDKYKGETEAE